MPRLSPVNQARWARFRHNRRGYWSLWIFAVLFVLSMCSELIANDKPLLVHFNDRWYVPVLANYSESDFGGPFATPAEYQDPWLRQQIEQHGWALWAPVRFGANSINFATTTPFPSPPSTQNWLGTDANGGDVLARILYGTRISILFGLMLTLFSSVMGVVAGAVQGYYGGKIDLWGQRIIEVRYANAIFDHPAVQRGTAELLVAARHHRSVRLDGAGGCRAGGVPAHP